MTAPAKSKSEIEKKATEIRDMLRGTDDRDEALRLEGALVALSWALGRLGD